MIRFQLVERPGQHLFGALCSAMAGGDLKTFTLQKRRRKVVHTSYPGWMNWRHESGVVICEVISPAKPGYEWQFFHAFIGRLANRFAPAIHSIAIQFVTQVGDEAPGRRGGLSGSGRRRRSPSRKASRGSRRGPSKR